MEQKVIQIGHSVGVIIPQALQKGSRLNPGEKVVIERDYMSDSFIVRKKGNKKHSSITPEFVHIVESVNKKYRKALQELAGK